MLFKEKKFQEAVPVWAEGKKRNMNTSIWLEAVIEGAGEACLRITGANDYQVFVNGFFCHYGPARAGRGHYRVDEVMLGAFLSGGTNKIRILASAHNVDNYCFFNEEGFICAEIVRKGQVLCATGTDLWRAYDYPEKIVRTQRYSFQRVFSEAYDFTGNIAAKELALVPTEKKLFIEREVPYPALERNESFELTECGRVRKKEAPKYYKDRAINNAGVGLIGGFKPEELDICNVWRLNELELFGGEAAEGKEAGELTEGHYERVMAEGELTGFIELKLRCESDCELFVAFDEILTEDGSLNYTRLGCSNVIYYKLNGGRDYRLISAQPYSLKFLDLICQKGEIFLEKVGLVRLDFDKRLIKKRISAHAPEDIKKIFEAAVSTFRQNTVDIYMDCPSRERAGWLCDSFFTSRVERLLTGASTVEHAFLANFAMENGYNAISEGMLPMCYPAEHPDGVFIPNWAMWYLIELKEYLARTGDSELVAELKDKIYGLVDYFEGFENGEGLLERLDSWVFVEWSRSNQLTQDINYPSNMLYHAFLKTVGELYLDEALTRKAERLKAVIRRESKLDLFFCDNSVYKGDVAALSGEATESCQYYAFFTGVATPEEDGALWECLVKNFGPHRDRQATYPEVAPSNAFIGNYLRCELLMRYGLKEQLRADIEGYFLYMAERTSTLWENDTVSASCNHGFASHVLVWLDYLGYLDN